MTKKNQSLLDKALTLTKPRKTMTLSEEELELVEAWLDGKISLVQFSSVLNATSGNSAYAMIANGCKQIWQGMKEKK